MFETSVIQGQVVAARGRFRLLTVSILTHSAVIVGVAAVSVASVEFPRSAPDEFSRAPVLFSMQIPPPLGTRNGGATRAPEPARPATPPPPRPNQITAPQLVPDDVPQVDAPSAGDSDSTSTGDPNATGSGPLGDPLGEEGSVGDLDAPPIAMAGPPPVEERIYQAHEVKPPVALYKPPPAYPQQLIRTKMKATVIVRCIIDRNGRVRDPQVIVGSQFTPFNDAVIRAVQQWRFTPGSLGDQAVESYLNLTVQFSAQ